MASFSSGLYSGPIFEVIAGLDRKCFLVHASILARSDRLRAMLESGWKEREERKIGLEYWDEETIGRMVEWLYTEDYSSPRPTRFVHNMVAVKEDMQRATGGHKITPVALPTTEDSLGPDITHQGNTLDADKALIADVKDRPQPLTHIANEAFDVFTKSFDESSIKVLERWLRSCKHDPHELDFEATLLAHAKVYSLSNYMLLENLQTLAFRHLHYVLSSIDSRITANSPTVNNLVTLIRYVYANTHRPNVRKEPLRDLLTTLIARNFGSFNDGGEGQVRRLMDEGGDFATDVWEKVSSHMDVLQKDLRESLEKNASLETEMRRMRRKRRTGWADGEDEGR